MTWWSYDHQVTLYGNFAACQERVDNGLLIIIAYSNTQSGIVANRRLIQIIPRDGVQLPIRLA